MKETHICKQMPDDEFAEKENTCWHIHKKDKKHSDFRFDLKSGICPYCRKDLEVSNDQT